MAVFGSRPEFGSSQNKYLGFITTALAIATLFCIPPDNSEGSLFNESDKLTLSINFRALLFFSLISS